jgi:apolipoprotein D and lipocalin family protein
MLPATSRSPFAILAATLFLGLVAFGLAGGGPASASNSTIPPSTVTSVDLQRYQGRWVQLATIPAPFQRDCARNTAANYTALPDGLIKVMNRCTAADGRRIVIEGRARIVDPGTRAKLQVTFVQANGEWVFVPGGDYWILGLASDYQWAIIGDPQRVGGFILSRANSLDGAQLLKVLLTILGKGYNPCSFQLTPAGPPSKDPATAVFAEVFTQICG